MWPLLLLACAPEPSHSSVNHLGDGRLCRAEPSQTGTSLATTSAPTYILDTKKNVAEPVKRERTIFAPLGDFLCQGADDKFQKALFCTPPENEDKTHDPVAQLQ